MKQNYKVKEMRKKTKIAILNMITCFYLTNIYQ